MKSLKSPLTFSTLALAAIASSAHAAPNKAATRIERTVAICNAPKWNSISLVRYREASDESIPASSYAYVLRAEHSERDRAAGGVFTTTTNDIIDTGYTSAASVTRDDKTIKFNLKYEGSMPENMSLVTLTIQPQEDLPNTYALSIEKVGNSRLIERTGIDPQDPFSKGDPKDPFADVEVIDKGEAKENYAYTYLSGRWNAVVKPLLQELQGKKADTSKLTCQLLIAPQDL